ncbi:MAG: hypothetical protein Kow00122_01490 [Thermoleophilia bacterium]
MILRPPDVDLRQALGDFRAALKRTVHRRVAITAEVIDGRVIGHAIEVSPLTEADLERIMRERPQPAGRGRRWPNP